AQRPSADSHSAEDLCLITHTNLAQFDTRLKHSRQILDQLTKIDSSVCRKIKEHLVVVKGILRIDQLHLQLMGTDFFLADFKGFLFFSAVCLFLGVILRRRQANHLSQRLDHLFILDLLRSENDIAILHASGCFHDDMIADTNIKILRRKIIYFSHITEPYSDNFCHSLILLDRQEQKLHRQLEIYIRFQTYSRGLYRVDDTLQSLIGALLCPLLDIIDFLAEYQ